MQHPSTSSVSSVQGEYLIRIYTTIREGSRIVGSRLANRLGVSASAVTQAFQRMERQGLAVIDQESGIQLTTQGRSIAESIIRRHYLIIERLLVDTLGFNWADADDEAERLEHTLITQAGGLPLRKAEQADDLPAWQSLSRLARRRAASRRTQNDQYQHWGKRDRLEDYRRGGRRQRASPLCSRQRSVIGRGSLGRGHRSQSGACRTARSRSNRCHARAVGATHPRLRTRFRVGADA